MHSYCAVGEGGMGGEDIVVGWESFDWEVLRRLGKSAERFGFHTEFRDLL